MFVINYYKLLEYDGEIKEHLLELLKNLLEKDSPQYYNDKPLTYYTLYNYGLIIE
jgi:hypothetical protein